MSISYFSQPLGIDTIPNFISARSEIGLRRLILKNNTRHKGFVTYSNIQWVESKQKWYAWYYVKADLDSLVGEVK